MASDAIILEGLAPGATSCAETILAAAAGTGRTFDAGVLLGLILLAAIIGGHAVRLAHVPRVVGYLLAGVALKLALVAVFSQTEEAEHARELLTGIVHPLRILKTLALGLIMFVIGNVFEAQHVKAVGPRVLKVSLIEMLCIIVLVSVGCCLVWVFSTNQSVGEVVAAGMLLGIVGLATAPAATLLVLREYDAKGPVSDTILSMTAINNTVSIILFHSLILILAAAGVIATEAAGQRWVWLDLLLISVGSILLGCALGFLFSVLYAKMGPAEFMLVFLAVLIGLGAGTETLANALGMSFSFLLTCLFMGAVFSNVTVNSGGLYENIRMIGTPIFAGFFVLAGFELHLEDLGALGLLGGSYVVLRTVGKYVGVRAGIRWADWETHVPSFVGLGLLCQAGVAIGLADFLANTWMMRTPEGLAPHPLAEQFKTVVLGSVVVFEIIGPVVLKGAVKRSGEVKALTLIRRGGSRPLEGDPIVAATWSALMRTLGLSRGLTRAPTKDLAVRDIMRSNIRYLHASAKLDEVLHFVEGSRYNHFPVVDEEGQFLGMIHFSDLRNMIYDPTIRELVTAVDLACPDDLVPADMRLNDLLERFRCSDVGSLVVVRPGTRTVVGLVEQRDLLRVLHGDARNNG